MVKYAFATEEQRELAEGAYKIVKNELEPRIEEYELADGGLGVYPMDVHQTLVEAGYFALSIPEEWGGLGMDMVTQGLIIEEIGKVDAGFAFAFAGSGCYFDRILATKMSDEEKQMWADKILAGAMGTFCLTEPEAGSDAAALKTTAVYDEKTDEWIINGTKCFASNAPNAEYFIIFAWTDKSKRASQGVSAFFVEKDRGVQLGKKENKMGLHLSETSDVILDNVRVPADHMIGEPGKGFGMALGGISGAGAIVNCAPLLGMSQACIEQAVEYTQQRRQFGSRVVDFQAVGFMIADMEMRTQACRSMVYDALRAADEGVKTNLDLCIKAYTSDCTMQTALDTVQVMGGYGYMKEYPAERWMRNAKIFQIFEGTNQIQRLVIAREMIERDPMKARK